MPLKTTPFIEKYSCEASFFFLIKKEKFIENRNAASAAG